MEEEGTQKVDHQEPAPSVEEKGKVEEKAPKDVTEEKAVIPPPEQKVVPAVNEKGADIAVIKSTEGSVDRDALLAQVTTEKRFALIKAWEESEKTKADNKAHRKLSAVGSWENSHKASVEAQLKKIEEKFDKKKAEYAEKMKNKVADLHKEAEEKRATIDAKRREEFLKVEETATKFRASGYIPKKILGCFSY